MVNPYSVCVCVVCSTACLLCCGIDPQELEPVSSARKIYSALKWPEASDQGDSRLLVRVRIRVTRPRASCWLALAGVDLVVTVHLSALSCRENSF